MTMSLRTTTNKPQASPALYPGTFRNMEEEMTPELFAKYLHHLFWFLVGLMFWLSFWGVSIATTKVKGKDDEPPR